MPADADVTLMMRCRQMPMPPSFSLMRFSFQFHSYFDAFSSTMPLLSLSIYAAIE